jgi:hypothetical protein
VLPYHHPDDVVRIRTPEWCRHRLDLLSHGLLSSTEPRPRLPLPVLCVAEQADVVLVLREQPEQTWSLVWTRVSVEVSGIAPDGERWVVLASGTCERERLPGWAAADWARSSHPASGLSPGLSRPPYGLRLRDAGLRGYSVESEAAAG